jgi:hypothetical protein
MHPRVYCNRIRSIRRDRSGREICTGSHDEKEGFLHQDRSWQDKAAFHNPPMDSADAGIVSGGAPDHGPFSSLPEYFLHGIPSWETREQASIPSRERIVSINRGFFSGTIIPILLHYRQ